MKETRSRARMSSVNRALRQSSRLDANEEIRRDRQAIFMGSPCTEPTTLLNTRSSCSHRARSSCVPYLVGDPKWTGRAAYAIVRGIRKPSLLAMFHMTPNDRSRETKRREFSRRQCTASEVSVTC